MVMVCYGQHQPRKPDRFSVLQNSVSRKNKDKTLKQANLHYHHQRSLVL